MLAEGVGFEPTLRFPVNTLSKRAPSATRPPLLIAALGAAPSYIKSSGLHFFRFDHSADLDGSCESLPLDQNADGSFLFFDIAPSVPATEARQYSLTLWARNTMIPPCAYLRFLFSKIDPNRGGCAK